MSKIYGFLSNSSEKEFVEKAIRQVLKPARGETVLEPGFGTGQVLAALAEMVGEEGRVFGLDVSDGMVEATRKRLLKLGLAGRAELVRGDATNTRVHELHPGAFSRGPDPRRARRVPKGLEEKRAPLRRVHV